MAQAAGHNIAGVLSITESVRWDTPVARESFDAPMEMADAVHDDFEVPVQLGEVSVRAQVEVVYVLR